MDLADNLTQGDEDIDAFLPIFPIKSIHRFEGEKAEYIILL